MLSLRGGSPKPSSCSRSRLMQFDEERSMFWARTDPNTRQWECTPSGVATAIQTVPTGLPGVPPVGPAMPVVEMPYVAPVARRTPSAICSATLRLTAPYRFRLSGSTPSSAVFTSFE